MFSHCLSVLIRIPIKCSELLLNDALHSLSIYRNLISTVFVMLCSSHVKLYLTEYQSIFSYTVCAVVTFYSFNVVMNSCCNTLKFFVAFKFVFS